MSAGKFTAARRDHYLAAYGADPAGTQALLNALTPVPRLAACQALPEPEAHPDATAAYRALYPPAGVTGDPGGATVLTGLPAS